MFKIIGNDQQEYGPVPTETLRQWIAEGRANANTLVQTEGGAEWQPLSTVAEFATALQSTNAGGQTQTLSPSSPSVPTHLTSAILTTLCCCLPVGIVAIVYAAQVNSKLAGGDYEGAQTASKNAKMWCWIALALGLVVVAVELAIAIPNFMSARSAAQRNVCINNLRMLDGATAQWALENKKEDGAPVTLDDLKPYLRQQSLPLCPVNGKYSVSKVGERPRCTVPDHNLNFSRGGRPRPNQGDPPRLNPGPRPRPNPRDQPERDRP